MIILSPDSDVYLVPIRHFYTLAIHGSSLDVSFIKSKSNLLRRLKLSSNRNNKNDCLDAYYNGVPFAGISQWSRDIFSSISSNQFNSGALKITNSIGNRFIFSIATKDNREHWLLPYAMRYLVWYEIPTNKTISEYFSEKLKHQRVCWCYTRINELWGDSIYTTNDQYVGKIPGYLMKDIDTCPPNIGYGLNITCVIESDPESKQVVLLTEVRKPSLTTMPSLLLSAFDTSCKTPYDFVFKHKVSPRVVQRKK